MKLQATARRTSTDAHNNDRTARPSAETKAANATFSKPNTKPAAAPAQARGGAAALHRSNDSASRPWSGATKPSVINETWGNAAGKQPGDLSLDPNDPPKKEGSTEKSKPQKTATASELENPSKSKQIKVEVSGDVPADAPLPEIVKVSYGDYPDWSGGFSSKVSSQVVVKGASGDVAVSELDSDHTSFDLTDPEVENEVVVDGWKYTYQVVFDGKHNVEKVIVLDAKKV